MADTSETYNWRMPKLDSLIQDSTYNLWAITDDPSVITDSPSAMGQHWLMSHGPDGNGPDGNEYAIVDKVYCLDGFRQTVVGQTVDRP